MGQDSSIISDDTPPETLRERSLAAVAEYIKSGQVRRIVVMTGAGISTAAGSESHVPLCSDQNSSSLQFPTSARQKPASTPTSPS